MILSLDLVPMVIYHLYVHTNDTKPGLDKFLLNLSKLYNVAQDRSNPICFDYFYGSNINKAVDVITTYLG